MPDVLFWKECQKTLQKDFPLEEYSTWIAPMLLRENEGTNPQSYTVLAPNKFILSWVEDNYADFIRERLTDITQKNDLNISFEVDNNDIKSVTNEEYQPKALKSIPAATKNKNELKLKLVLGLAKLVFVINIILYNSLKV